MPWISDQITYEDAVARKLPVWEVIYSNWGDAIAPDSELSFPIVGAQPLPSVYGVAIGPRSLVDRCFVAYDRQKNVTSPYGYYRPVSVGAPLLFSQPASATPGAVTVVDPTSPPYAATSVVVYANPLPLDNANGLITSAGEGFSFGGSYFNIAGTQVSFNMERFFSPVLHLYFLLKPPDQIPLKRANAFIAGTFGGTANVTTAIAHIPVCGRKTLNITMRSTQIATFTAGLILNAEGGQETLVGTAAAVPLGTSQRFVVDNAYGDILTLYALSVPASSVTFEVQAED